MPIHCLLCGTGKTQVCLCDQCVAALPELGQACPRCATPINHTSLCGQCLNHPPIQDRSFSLFPYQAPIDRLIIDMKYHDTLFLCDFFAQRMAQKLNKNVLPTHLIPIPLHPRRLRERGYNQSLEIARALSKELGIPVIYDILIRTRDTVPQASLPYTQRQHNIRQAFSVINANVPQHIALIDDVLTTGHTANVAAQTLRNAGANYIELWTIARTISHDHSHG